MGMKCETCEKDHDGTYGSGRFCSKTCAKKYSALSNKDDVNKRISDTLFKRYHNGMSKQEFIQKKIAHRHASYEPETEITSLLDLSKRTVHKIVKRMEIPCSLCGWFVKGVSGDIHHIIEKKKGGTNEHSNLTYVCPNCHRSIHSNVIDKNSLITLETQIGDKWKEYYYVKNGKLINKDG